jgi:outer membrane protein
MPNLRNGPLLSQMVHNGKLEVSLNDFLRLVAENALDLESGRYTYLIAQTDLLRAKSGQAARGLPGAPVPEGLFAGAIGAGLGNSASVSNGGTGGTSISAAAKQIFIGPRGTFDPTLSANFSLDRVVSPLNTVRVSGSPTVTVPSAVLQTIFQQELPTGTGYSVSFNLQRQGSTQRFLLFNPSFQSFFSAQVYQPLLNGFGLALNRRFIRFAENNRKISNEVFQERLNTSLSNAANLYWDFVAITEQVRVAEQTVAAAQTLYDNNRVQAQIGTLAQLDVLQSQSQLAASRRDLTIAQGNLRMQEIKLKSAISKSIESDLAEAAIEPLDPLPQAPEIEVPQLTDALNVALRDRPLLRQAQLGIENLKIAEQYTRKTLLPTLGAFVQFNSYALAGSPGPMFRQMVQWDYPQYAAGFSLTVSVFNRAAQADNLRARLESQRAELALRQTRRQAGSAVRNALVALIQAKAQIEAAQQARESREAAFRGEQARLQNGLAAPYAVILAQRDLVDAQSAEIQVRVNAAKAQVALQNAMSTLLEGHGISFEDALRGDVFTGSARP